MKRILATTTILALSAGFAAAEVTLSGDARMGIISDFGGADTAFTSRARVSFSLSGESDSGFSFGASFRADNAGSASSGEAGSVWIEMSGFKLSMGDVDGAAAAAAGQVDGVSLTGLGDLNEISYIANGGYNGYLSDHNFFAFSGMTVTADPSVLASYTAGALTIYASVNQLGYSYWDGIGTWESNAYAVGAAYAAGNYKLSIGYERHEETDGVATLDADNLVLGADATFGALTVKARLAEGGSVYDGNFDWQENSQWALSATYVVDALTLTAFASSITLDNLDGYPDFVRDAYGLGAAYDLGGGASLVGGYAKNQTEDDSAFDLGLSFSF